MKCAGCNKEIEIGDHYIEDTPSGFLEENDNVGVDEFIVILMGGTAGKIYFCEDCTEPGGDYLFETYYGDEDEE